MKKLFAVAALALLGAGAADAAVFAGTVTLTDTGSTTNKINVTGSPSPATFNTGNLNANSLFNTTAFFNSLITLNTTFNTSGCVLGCTAADTVSLAFNFTSPGAASFTQNGTASETAYTFAGVLDGGTIRWANNTNFDVLLLRNYAETTVTFANGAQALVDVFDAALTGPDSSLSGGIDVRIRDVADGRTSPVPEAATWAMMVAGFGLAGAACRRRRTSLYLA